MSELHEAHTLEEATKATQEMTNKITRIFDCIFF